MEVRRTRSQQNFGEELRRLLEERDVSLRKFAASIGVSQPYLSRAMTGERRPSLKLLVNATKSLGLEADYFPEYRAYFVIEAVKADGTLRDRIFDELKKRDASIR